MVSLAGSYLLLLFQELDRVSDWLAHAMPPSPIGINVFCLLLLSFYSIFHLKMEIYTEISMIWKKYQGKMFLKYRKLSKRSNIAYVQNLTIDLMCPC